MKKLLFFHATWCPPCRFCLKNVIEPLMADHEEQVEVIDAQKEPARAERMNVYSLPTFLLLDREKEVWRHVGSIRIDEIKRLLDGDIIHDYM